MTRIPEIRNYNDARVFLGNRKQRSCPNMGNTYVTERTPGLEIAVFFHATAIVTYLATGKMVLRNGGYWTRTTLRRLNTFLPVGFSVFQQHKTWWIKDGTKVQPFVSGMILDPDRGPGGSFIFP